MRLSGTLSLYMGRQYLQHVALVFLLVILTILIADTIELLRRASGSDKTATLEIVLQMASLHIPFMAQKALPFVVLVGGIVTFAKLTRSRELVVARAAGVSVWQFILPVLIISALLGGLFMMVINPLASATTARFEQMDATHLRGSSSLMALSKSGIWLRQGDAEGQSVVHAERIDQDTMTLHDAIIFLYAQEDHFVGRIDAAEARLEDGYWNLTDALFSAPDEPARHRANARIPTDLTLERIQNSFSPPETLSFWALPGFIDVLEESGFSSVKHHLHWHSLLAGPLLLCAMVLIAATFSLRFTRRGTWVLVVGGLLTGFLFYFLSDLVLALGLSGKLPPILAAWTPAGIFTLVGVAGLFHLEDG